MKTAIVLGATGLVGNELTQLLLNDTRFEKVKVLTRRSTGITNARLEEHIINFDEPDTWKKLLDGDVLYSALGTTLKAAGGKKNQYKVDYTYQYTAAKYAAAHDVKQLVLVSAAGASPYSNVFYSRMKGELERDIQKLPFETIHIVKPGMLDGTRKEARPGEKIGVGIMKFLSHIPGLNLLKPISGNEVARAMINITFKQVVGIYTYSMGKVLKLGK